jgi:hypothetical protein
VRLGRAADAVDLAAGIDHPWFGGWAGFATAMQCGDLGDTDAARRVVEQLTKPWWRAAGLAALALNAAQTGGIAAAQAQWDEAQRLLRTVPPGDSRSRLLDLMCCAAIAAEQFPTARECLTQMTGDLEFRLLRLGAMLTSCTDRAGALGLVEHFGTSASTALFLCTVLAELFPDSSAAIEQAIVGQGA